MELYVHLPFCRQKCRYCDFASWAGMEDRMDFYTELLLREAKERKGEMEGPAETVYFGGGTPSLLPPALLKKLIRGLRDTLGIREGAEFTAEANPGTLTEGWLETARESGINRLSLGVQARQDHLLEELGRIHRFREAEEAFAMARRAGFRNLSLDLMFGLPKQTMEDWRETLEAALSLSPEHISAYGLIPEEGTPLMADLEGGRLQLPEPEEERAMYDLLKRMLSARGFEAYEISNFARPGYACRHNLGYWTQVPYLGLGLSAASMVHMEKKSAGVSCLRLSNPRSWKEYEDTVLHPEKGGREVTLVTPPEARFETLMLGFRLSRGVSEQEFEALHGLTLESFRGEKLRRLQAQGLMEHAEGRWFLTDRGMDIQNSVLVELMD